MMQNDDRQEWIDEGLGDVLPVLEDLSAEDRRRRDEVFRRWGEGLMLVRPLLTAEALEEALRTFWDRVGLYVTGVQAVAAGPGDFGFLEEPSFALSERSVLQIQSRSGRRFLTGKIVLDVPLAGFPREFEGIRLMVTGCDNVALLGFRLLSGPSLAERVEFQFETPLPDDAFSGAEPWGLVDLGHFRAEWIRVTQKED